MARTFRYQYVDFGTSFVGDPRSRDAQNGNERPGTLFANSLATDVGGTCWGPNEPLAVIDHHFHREGQFPSASAAVLHKAEQIHQRFEGQKTIWLITHKEPDFDAFCSMYLARWIIEDRNFSTNLRECRLPPESWLDAIDRPRIDWFNPEVGGISAELRWAILLASYASVLETRRRISCPRQRALRSILYAAIKRGRDYLSENSGATEFFDEVRSILVRQQLNPIFDSVLEGNTLFAPELAMLDREVAAYERDIVRARRSTVYLPESEAPSPDFFKHPAEVAAFGRRRSSDLDAEHLLLADTFRIATDGIYLRDPECLLFKEWVRLDLEHSGLGAGFEFTAIAHSNGRPEATSNKSDYQFSIDPERANGRHLYTVWSRLQTQEVEALRTHEEGVLAGSGAAAKPPAGSHGNETLGTLLADPWAGGQSQYGIEVGTPHRGTLIAPAGKRDDLRDDPVAEAVRTELENSIYSAASLVTGPQVMVSDLAAAKEGVDIGSQEYDLNNPLGIPAPPESYFRFASVRLRSDVALSTSNLARQIGETLWQVLYPDMPGSTPADFAEQHLVVDSNRVGVWSDRGVAIAQKQPPSTRISLTDSQIAELRAEFAQIVSLARDADRLTARWSALNDGEASKVRKSDVQNLQAFSTSANDFASHATEVKHKLVLPESDLFRRFYEAMRIDPLLATLREMAIAASEQVRRHQETERLKQMESRTGAIARVQRRLEWLEVLLIGCLAIGIIDAILPQVNLNASVEQGLALLGGPLAAGLAALVLRPWRQSKPLTSEDKLDRPWFLIVLVITCVIVWLASLVQFWKK